MRAGAPMIWSSRQAKELAKLSAGCLIAIPLLAGSGIAYGFAHGWPAGTLWYAAVNPAVAALLSAVTARLAFRAEKKSSGSQGPRHKVPRDCRRCGGRMDLVLGKLATTQRNGIFARCAHCGWCYSCFCRFCRGIPQDAREISLYIAVRAP